MCDIEHEKEKLDISVIKKLDTLFAISIKHILVILFFDKVFQLS